MIEVIESPMPSIINPNSPEFDPARVIEKDGYYLCDEKIILCKGSLTIKSAEHTLVWLVWINIEATAFIEMTENLMQDNDHVTTYGKLQSDILFYPNTAGLKIKLFYDLNNPRKIPEIEIPKADSDLYQDYNFGMPKDKFYSIQEILQ